MIIHSSDPFNAEPSLSRLCSAPVTARDDFYVRSHGNTPTIDPATYLLKVGGLVAKPLSLTLGDLRSYPQTHVEATLQCAGNRRADMLRIRPVAGDPWSAGAIGNACWSGVRLADVLDSAGAQQSPDLHVSFSSLDDVEMDGKNFRYGASIPMSKACSPEVLVALDMNGSPLTEQHGFPVRIVTPGFAGARSPKWLAAVDVQDAPSTSPIQVEDYKLLPPDIERVSDIDWSRGITINELPVNSAICEPSNHQRLAPGKLRLCGWAMATARDIVRVDVSIDGGRNWRQAVLEPRSKWSWTLWKADVELGVGEHEIVVRAWDSAGQTQPAMPDDTWNVKGYLSASWHRIIVSVEHQG